MFNKSKIFVSGATGSWGQTLVTLLLDRYDVEQIICFSRGELQQVLMKRKFNNPKLKFVIGDVRDAEAVKFATKGVDYIFHLAALKHVPVCEENVQETIKTNINGTTSIVNAAIENRVKKVIDVSSDKAVEPINLYGMTKSREKPPHLTLDNELKRQQQRTRERAHRPGNMLGPSTNLCQQSL